MPRPTLPRPRLPRRRRRPAPAKAAAEQAKAEADAAQASAQQATADVTSRKAALDAEAARYKELYDSLSEQERQAAAAAAEAAKRQQRSRCGRRNQRKQHRLRLPRTGPRTAAAAAARRRRRIVVFASPAPARMRLRLPRRPVARPPSAAVAAALSKVGTAYVYGAAGPEHVRLLRADLVGLGAGRRDHPADLRRSGRPAVCAAE